MDDDSECFDPRALASPAARFRGFGPRPAPAAYRCEDIGYEAADPALQASLWHEPMPAQPAGSDER